MFFHAAARKTFFRKVVVLVLTGFIASFFIFPAGASMVVPEGTSAHVVISEIQTNNLTVYDDFVELYNPTSEEVDLSEWSVQKTNSSGGALYRKALSGVIPAHGYFLIVRDNENTQASLKDMADVLASGSSFTLASNYVVYLVNDNVDIESAVDENIVDMVGMDTAEIYEGSGTAIGPGQGESIERKSGLNHDEDAGNGYDTDDNANDFMIQDSPSPQNTHSAPEPTEDEGGGEDEPSDEEEEQDGEEDQTDEDYIADHLVISEVQIFGETQYDDFVELYNPTSEDVDLTDWSVQKTNKTGGGIYRKELSGTVASHGYYLIVRNNTETDQFLKNAADVLGSASGLNLFEDNIVYLVNDNEDIEGAGDVNIIDMVGMGEADYYEGTQAAFNPDDSKSIERKSGPIHEWNMGNGYDTDDNRNDFMIQDAPSPQNIQSAFEPVEDDEEAGDEEGEEVDDGEEDGEQDDSEDGDSGDADEEGGDEDQGGEGDEQGEEEDSDEGEADHPVISEIQTSGVSMYDDFVEVYNPTDEDVDLSDWSIQKTNSTGGALYRKALSGTIPAGGYFLVVRDHEQTQSSLKDMADVLAAGSGFALSSNYVVYLVNDNEDIEGAGDNNIVDLVGMDTAEIYEGTATAPGPSQGESIERKSGPTHEEGQGNGYDTNENADDFVLRENPEPQNSQSGVEPVEDGDEDEDQGDGENGEGEEDEDDGEDSQDEEDGEEEDQDGEEEDSQDEEGDEDEQNGENEDDGIQDDEDEQGDEGGQEDEVWQAWKMKDFEAIRASRQKEPKELKEPKF